MRNKKQISCAQIFRNRNLLIIDIFLIILAYFCTFMLINNVFNALNDLLSCWIFIALNVVVFIGVECFFGIYNTMWRYGGTRDYAKVVWSCVIADIIIIAADLLFFPHIHIKLAISGVGIADLLILMLRMSVRGINNLIIMNSHDDAAQKRLLIVGAGLSASVFLKDIINNNKLNYHVVCFVDDDPAKRNFQLNGIKVMGTRYDIPKLCREKMIDEILIAAPSASAEERKELVRICQQTNKRVQILASVDQMMDDAKTGINHIRGLSIEDLLARDTVVLNNENIRGYITDKVVLVTGGGGSIGSELCRQIMRFKPKKLVILDIYENNAYDLQMELNTKYPSNKPDVVIASVRDKERLDNIFEKYRPYVVFHAAAHKHVPLMEDSPGEAIKNNIFGTLNVARCASEFGTKRFVMISTDKAVNPTNVMGATKRVCEMIIQCMQTVSKTEFVAVRFGNVLGSNGSVIPLFKKQIENGGPVTVTHREITRFFMTIPEAAQLVLEAAGNAKGGEIFVLDMGEPVKIYDLAENIIRLAGYTPNVDIDIVITGLRPGEKLYEELLMDEEGLINTSHNKIFIGKPINITYDELSTKLELLHSAAEEDDSDKIKDIIASVVPTYVRK